MKKTCEFIDYAVSKSACGEDAVFEVRIIVPGYEDIPTSYYCCAEHVERVEARAAAINVETKRSAA
jgi:hypothetical protein